MSEHLPRRALLTGAAGLAAAAAIPLTATAASADPIPKQPRIYSCEEWGARPPVDPPTILQHRPNKIVVHHTAYPNVEDFSLEYAFANSRSIQNLHMDKNGWNDSGQHFTNSRGGFITEGRRGSLDALLGGTTMVQSAHTVGQNTQSIGIENDGSYHLGELPTHKQWKSLIRFCAFICHQYEIAPTEIYGHKDFNNTLCPGGIHAKLPWLREEVAHRLYVDFKNGD